MGHSGEHFILEPAFVLNRVSVAVASDANYVPYLATALKSIIAHSSPENNYDLVVLSQGIPTEDQLHIQAMADGLSHISLRFLDVSGQVEQRAGDLFTSAHVSAAAYYRLFTPTIFQLYPKLLYLDIDLVALSDVAELFKVDLEGAAVGAVRDYLAIRDLPRKENAKWRRQLSLKDHQSYFNSGVMLLNLELLRQEAFEEQFFELLARLKQPRLHDQDILNSVCQGRVKYLDPAWNNLAWAEACGELVFKGELSEELYQEYVESKRSPKLLHYLSRHKPWNLPHLELADRFWVFASLTPYYDRLIFNTLRRLSAENDVLKSGLKTPSVRLKYWFYKLMSLATSGGTRSKYRAKAFRLKKMNRPLKSILNSWN